MSVRVTFAQNREDIILDAFFADVETGFYVDVGANHPEHDSVTKYFYEKGWAGLNIEPNKALYNQLLIERPNDININVGVSDKKGSLNFREYVNHGLSTFSSTMKKEYEKTNNIGTDAFEEYEVEVLTLAEIFKAYKIQKIHFLKVDVEGFEYEVLAGNDWLKYRPEMICIESNHIVNDWRPILVKYNYKKVFFDGLNDYYLANESTFRKNNFSYPEQIVLGPPVIHISSYNEIKNAQKETELATKKYLHEKVESSRLRAHVDYLHEEIVQDNTTKKQMRNLLYSIDKSIYRRIDNIGKRIKDQYPANEVYDDVKDKIDLLRKVRRQDFVGFYTSAGSKKIAHTAVLGTYNTARKGLKIGAKLGMKVIKKAKRIRI